MLVRLRSSCGAACIFGHGGDFSWHAQGKSGVLVVQSRLFAGARDRSGLAYGDKSRQVHWVANINEFKGGFRISGVQVFCAAAKLSKAALLNKHWNPQYNNLAKAKKFALVPTSI